MKNKLSAVLGSLLGLLLVSLNSFAAITVTSITDAITDASTAIATVGLAVLVMIVGAKVFKWIRRAL